MKSGGVEMWTAVDQYIERLLVGDDAALHAVLQSSQEGGLPAIAVSPAQGKWLSLMAKAIGARRILEIGTLGGYSTIWLARALPSSGKLLTIEMNLHHADVARRNFSRAGVAHLIDVRVGRALEVLPALANEPPFDFVFIDADKPPYAEYLDWSIKLSHSGTMIVADNVVRDGDVLDEQSNDAAVQGIRRFNDALASDTRVSATELQTVGVKGYDGFAVVLVNS